MSQVLIDSHGASVFVGLCVEDIDYSLFFATGCIEICIGGNIVCRVNVRPDATDSVSGAVETMFNAWLIAWECPGIDEYKIIDQKL